MEINIRLDDTDFANPNVRTAIVALSGMSETAAAFAAPIVTAEKETSAPQAPADTEQPQPTQRRSRSRKENTPEPTPEPAAESEAANETSAEPEADTPGPEPTDYGDEPMPIPSVTELRAKAQEVGTTKERKLAVKALLDAIGAKGISEVPEDKRIQFMFDLDKLAEEDAE